ncbi:MAG: cell division protein FtsZ [Alphaproteobacteria bacterium]
MTINLRMPESQPMKPQITVIGIGGAGGNAVNNMITSGLGGAEFVVANTDAQALGQSMTDRRVQLGVSITQGLGGGSRPEIGKAAAEEAIDEILEHLQGSNMAFIAAGMGGATGTGGAPVVARAAREQGILTVGVVTKPFHFEGTQRMSIAEEGLGELQQYVDSLIIIPNQNLFRVANEKTTFADAFKMADDVLHAGVRGVTDLMVMPGLINLDFADVRAVMGEMGKAMMGTGEAEGERRALDAADAAISNPLLDDMSMKGARGVLINITGAQDLTLFEADEAANRIRDEVDPDAHIIFGATFDESLAGRMRVSVVATGIEAEMAAAGDTVRRPTPLRPVLVDSREKGEASANAEPSVRVPEPEAGGEAESRIDEESEAGANKAAVSAFAQGGKRVFVPAGPVDPGLPKDAAGPAEPFAEAAMANGAWEPGKLEPRRGPSLFERMTGAGRAREPKPEPRANPTPPSPKAPEAGDQLAVSTTEEDVLDIPAFLRRQGN